MTFPTTPVLDDCSRPDENPLSQAGAWADANIFGGGEGRLELVSHVIVPVTPADGGSAYRAASIDAPCQFWATLAGLTGEPFVIACGGAAGTGAVTGYAVIVVDGTEILLTRFDGTSMPTNLGDFTGLTVSEGDSIGVDVDAATGTVTAYHKPSGGSWMSLGDASDTTYTTGFLGIGYSGTPDSSSGFTAVGGGVSDTLASAPARGIRMTLTDLDGHSFANAGSSHPMPARTTDQPQFTLPLSDSRTGQVPISMYELAAGAIASNPAKVVVKAVYTNPKGDSVALINGIVMNPSMDFDQGVVTATLHDHTVRLKKRFLDYALASVMLGLGETVDGSGDYYSSGILSAVGLSEFYGIKSAYGIPLDGLGLRLMILDASHGASDWPGGAFSAPSVGIRYTPGVNSIDEANQQPAYGTGGVPPTGFTFTGDVTAGSTLIENVTLPGSTYDITDVYTHGALSDSGGKLDAFAQVDSAYSTSAGDFVVMSQPAVADGTGISITLEDAVYMQPQRGDCVWDDVTDMVQAQGAFEADWIPVDENHTGPSGATWQVGQFIELHTANRIGSDRSQGNTDGNVPVVFVHGDGGFRLTASPDADQLVTRDVQVGPGGPADPLDILNKADVSSGTKVDEYGYWMRWDQATSAGVGDTLISNAVLENRAKATLAAYQDPPKFITAQIDTDEIGRYCFGTDFFLGDTVTVYAKKGKVTFGPVDVRITQVDLSQVDESGNCRIGLTMVPHLTADPGAVG